jgi:hypothetical protein
MSANLFYLLLLLIYERYNYGLVRYYTSNTFASKQICQKKNIEWAGAVFLFYK